MNEEAKSVPAARPEPAKKVRFKDPASKGINVPGVGNINDTHLSKPHIVRVLKRNAAWFAQHFVEQ